MLALVVLFALALCRYDKEWAEFKKKFGKHYEGKEIEKMRFKIFKDNMAAMKLYQKTDAHATYGITQFMDLTPEEFMSRHTTYEPINRSNVSTNSYEDYIVGDNVPDKFDWVSEGVINDARDQGSCGSCWAHAVVEGLESSYAIKHGTLYKLAPQQLVDCDSTDSGCSGGNLTLGESYCSKHKIVEESSYPYAGVDQKCKVNENDGVVKAADYGIIRGGEDAMRAALIEHGPLPVAINANPVQFYTGGILDPSTCNPNGINHAVLAIGYNLENNPPYWTILNSWGKSWGETDTQGGHSIHGTFRMKYGSDVCGVSRDATYIDAQ